MRTLCVSKKPRRALLRSQPTWLAPLGACVRACAPRCTAHAPPQMLWRLCCFNNVQVWVTVRSMSPWLMCLVFGCCESVPLVAYRHPPTCTTQLPAQHNCCRFSSFLRAWLTRSRFVRPSARYRGYFSYCRKSATKAMAYAGTATFVRDGTVPVLAAQDGITGVLAGHGDTIVEARQAAGFPDDNGEVGRNATAAARSVTCLKYGCFHSTTPRNDGVAHHCALLSRC